MGIFRAPEITIEPELRQEIDAIREWKAGRLSFMGLMDRLEKLQRAAATPDLVV